MADEPIKLGSAALSTLVAESGSHIATDDYGVQRGTVRHWLNDQSAAQSSRFALGATYSGSLPQFSGFYVEKSGDIQGIDATCAYLDVQYARIDPLWAYVPRRSHDLQLVNINPADLGTGFGELYATFTQVIVPVPHPVLTYKFGTSVYPSSLGTYGTPVNAPSISNYLFRTQTHDFSSSSIDVEERTIRGTGSLITFNANGTCTRTSFSTSATVTGIFSQIEVGTINVLNLSFTPDPSGWLCLKEDVIPTGNGAFYLVEQQWKRSYIFSGTSPGTWWQGARRIQC